jgi:hypothetical protein
VFMTGYREDVVEAEFDDVPVLRKPVAREDLEAALRKAMGDSARLPVRRPLPAWREAPSCRSSRPA